jgi:hypothetical protein
VADAPVGPTDLDGRPRTIGAAPDIGAYEHPSPPGAASPGDGAAPGGGAAGAPSTPDIGPDVTAPQLTSLALTNRIFAVGPAETPVAARAKRGTTFRLTLSESATVAIAFERSAPGRRAKRRRCVKPTRKNRKARKCKRWVKTGGITRGGSAGRLAIPFSGRIGKKALKPGSYRAVVTARDAAGNTSRKRTLAFKVVKR